MRKIMLLLVLGLLLTGCSQMPTSSLNPFSFGGSSDEGASLQEENIQFSGPQKGVVLNFRRGTPNDPINGRFGVIIDIANYMDEFVTVKLDLWDSTALTGFDSFRDAPKDINPAIYDDQGRFFGPSIFTNDLGKFEYVGVGPGSESQFFANVEYFAHTNAEVTFCVTDSFGESSNNCPESQSLSGSKLGESNSRTPVTVRSVKKTHSGGGGSVTLTLDIQISDVGRGRVVDFLEEGDPNKNIVEFNIIPQDGISNNFRCNSWDAADQSGSYDSNAGNLPMHIQLDKGKSADIHCTTDVDVDSALKNVKAKISLDYKYEYGTQTSTIKVASGVSKARST
jgi:hypothetical protein